MQPGFTIGIFDNLLSSDVRFLEAAARHGPLQVLLLSDAQAQQITGAEPKFPYAEREYFLSSLRAVASVVPLEELSTPRLPQGAAWLALPQGSSAFSAWQSAAAQAGLAFQSLSHEPAGAFPASPAPNPALTPPGKPKVIVSGCYDWLHSGHVRFFEEASAYGDLYVTVGSDAVVRELKGPGHPLQPQDERRFMVGAVRFVRQALVASGWGWLDALPEIQLLRPDFFVVNEDGDKPEKQELCREYGMQYIVLKRLPRPGLEARSSTKLRGY